MNALLNSPKKQLTAVAVALALGTSLAISGQQNTTAPGTAAQTPPAALYQGALPNFRQLIETNVPSVVSIRGSRDLRETANPMGPGMELPDNIPEPFRRFFEQMPRNPNGPRVPMPMAAQGSGFIISDDGYVLTNAHVVDGTTEVYVRLHDNREFKAEVVGSDERSDVALLKIAASGLRPAKVGNSEQLGVGDWVVAIGSPFGFDYSASQGIVSALGRSLPDGTYVPFIQTDVAVNPGNSGGPLFDLNGNVVGINSQIYSRSGGYQGLSFAIPIDLALNIVEQIKDQGYVSRGWLGVMIQDLNQPLADSFGMDTPRGALVSQVLPDSPADKAGIKVGDVILSYDGHDLDRSSELPPLVGTTPIDSSVAIEVMRDGKTVTLNTTIAELESSKGEIQLAKADSGEQHKLGVAVSELNAEQRDSLALSHGVLINDVEAGSPAARAGLRNGDVILSFNRQDVKSVDELSALIKKAPSDKPVVLLIKREDGTLFVPLQLS